ncbi:hypothetical protein BSNK01_15960 [Bacillaceae bacterium]
MRKTWLKAAGIAALAVGIAGSALADPPIKLVVDGEKVESDVPAQILNGRMLVPLRTVAESLGATVRWDEKTRSVEISRGPLAGSPVLSTDRPAEREEEERTRYYPQVPAKITTPEMALYAYFDALSLAANLTPEQMAAAAGGFLGMGEDPYRAAYGYWSKDWQAQHDFKDFLASWVGTGGVELLKLLPAGEADGGKRFFVETKHLEVVGEKPRAGYFYYTGFFTVKETADGWRITSGELEPQQLAWERGGHQAWRADPEMVARAELGGNGADPVEESVTEPNADGTVTVKFLDKKGNERKRVVLYRPQDGIWRVIDIR